MNFVNLNAIEQLHQQLRMCRLCADAGYEISGPPIVSGRLDSGVMIIGQAPGATEVQAQRPFNYTSGTRLFQWLGKAGWSEADFRERHYMAAVTRCYPGKHPSGRGDRVPTPHEQLLCSRWREQEFALLPNLKVIIPIGKLAIGLFLDNKLPLTEIVGKIFQQDGRFVVPLPHPSGASTWHMQPENQVLIDQAIEHLRDLREELNL